LYSGREEFFLLNSFSDTWFNGDVILRKENLTPRGMNIRFNLLTKSNTAVFCADWYACSLQSKE
jgi:hypothetical protein